MTAVRRLSKELQDIEKEQIPGIECSPLKKDDMYTWIAKMTGPSDSPYENGIFHLKLVFP